MVPDNGFPASIKIIEREVKEPLESAVQEKIQAYLKTREGWHGYKASDRYKKGVSDIVGSFWGFFVAFEVKKNAKEKPTKHQSDFLEKIRCTGGFGFVIWSPQMAKDHLDIIEKTISIRTQGLYKQWADLDGLNSKM